MKKLPRSYYRALTAKNNFKEFNELINKSDSSAEYVQSTLNIIKRIFVSYWKFLRDLLKERYNIVEFYPRKIITEAINRNLIGESEMIWLEYIDMLNILVYNNDQNEKNLIIKKIIDTYTKRISIIYDFMYKKNNYEKIKKNKSNNITLNYNMPIYDASELQINDNYYNLLLCFFKQNPQIKHVWLHGSRACGKARNNSDIDLLIDVQLDGFEELKKMMNRIRIPHRIDATSIYDFDNIKFIEIVSKQSKIIYRSEDNYQSRSYISGSSKSSSSYG